MGLPKKTAARARILCIVVTLTALFLVFRRIHLQSLEQVLQTMNPRWFAASILLYGLVFVPAAVRWHIALDLSESAVNYPTSLRLSVIGHFFYTIFFGAAGGDTAKSALYSRLYGKPLSGILAASSLDRVLGFGGLLLFGSGAIAVGLAHGAIRDLGSISIRWPWWWLIVAVALVGTAAFVLTRMPRQTFITHFVATFVSSARKLVRTPATLLIALACAFAVQVALSGVMALNLKAVTHTPVPWLRLAWTFPLITIIAALPVTVAGLGMREGAALLLLGLVNVSQPDAVAASLLTAIAGLVWTLVGSLLLWLEIPPGSPPAREKLPHRQSHKSEPEQYPNAKAAFRQ